MAIRVSKMTDAAVPNGANQALAHGLGVVPDLYFLTNDTLALIIESVATPPDAVNCYVDNGSGGPGLANVIAVVL